LTTTGTDGERQALIIAYYFPPIATSGAMRPLAFCRYLPSYGWQPRVVAVTPDAVLPPLDVDAELAARLPPGVSVQRVGHRNPTARLIDWRNRLLGRQPAGAAAGVPATPPAPPSSSASLLRSLRKEVLHHLLSFPDVQKWWRRAAVAAAMSGPRPDVVLATGGPWTSLLAGREVARRFDVPFIADFRDPWSRNPFRDHSAVARWRHRRLEQRVCTSAAAIIANTVELRGQFVADYPEIADRFVTIPNGFDDVNDASSVTARSTCLDRAQPLEICHFGTVYGKRSPTALLRAMCALLDAGAPLAGRVRLRFVGLWEADDPGCNADCARHESHGIVSRELSMPHQACLDAMRTSDLLMVLQPASPLQVPGKIYEYVSMGRPLLVIGGEGATASLVARHRLGRCCPNAVEPLQKLVMDLLEGAGFDAPPEGARDEFDYRRLTRSLATVLDAAVHGAVPELVPAVS
jgi:hypothetical protein